MNALKFIFLFAIGFHLFLSCKKGNDQPVIANDISGVYEGKFGTGTNNPSSFWSFRLKANGELEELSSDGTLTGKGTWTLDGTTMQASYHYLFPLTSFFSVTATYDASTKRFSGTWGYGSSNIDGGKWYMTKK